MKGLLLALLPNSILAFLSTIPALVFIIALGTSILFGLSSYHGSTHFTTLKQHDDSGASAYDKRQDDRMDAADARVVESEAQRKERHEDSLEHRRFYDAKEDIDHDRITRDEAYFSGAFFLLSILMTFNLLPRMRKEVISVDYDRTVRPRRDSADKDI